MLIEAFAEADKEVVDQLPIIDGVAKLTEFVSDGLEPLTVGADRRVTLHSIAKLGMQGVDAGVDVVLEQLAKGRP